MLVNTQDCKYPLLTACVEENKWKISQEGEADLYWSDKSVTSERVLALKPYQRINHFPGMRALSRKAQLATHLKRIQSVFPNEFQFVPQTWVLPKEWVEFETMMRNQSKKNKTYIVKPDHSSQGKGIFLTRSSLSIDRTQPQVIQRYIPRPLLIDGYKFDLRLYVLIRSIDPLYIYIYNNGLVRLCTTKYSKPLESNLESTTMHLTNYAVNKNRPDFVRNSNADEHGVGNKRSLQWLFEWLRQNEHDEKATWDRIKDCVVKTILSAQPGIASCTSDKNSSKCFELLGFDIMLDSKLRPWVIEVNHSPSFSATSPLDSRIKRGVLTDTLKLLQLGSKDKSKMIRNRKKQAQNRLYQQSKSNQGADRVLFQKELDKTEAKYKGGFVRAFPTDDPIISTRWNEILKGSKALYLQSIGIK